MPFALEDLDSNYILSSINRILIQGPTRSTLVSMLGEDCMVGEGFGGRMLSGRQYYNIQR